MSLYINKCSIFFLLRIISFLLQLTQFIGPGPCTDNSPNAILLSLHTEDTSSPLAYFVPVGNKYWPYFLMAVVYIMFQYTLLIVLRIH